VTAAIGENEDVIAIVFADGLKMTFIK